MVSSKITYKDTAKFSDLVIDYLDQKEELKTFYNRFPHIDNFKNQILEKKACAIDRPILVGALESQNVTIDLSKASKNNIQSLLKENTFTVTTGHQLCLFTGPLYFFYKIISTINLAESLREKYPSYNFVPVFWMASEDHDFEEINNIQLFGKKLIWNSDQKGAVGRMNLEGIEDVLNDLDVILGESQNAKDLSNLFRQSYGKSNIAEASRFLVNELFGEYGLVVIDGDDKELKNQFSPIIKKDVEDQALYPVIKCTTGRFSENYKTQAYVREINFFKLSDNNRLRVDSPTKVDDAFSYSPNVLARPLFQEAILPNIAYIGGGAEVSYWMQLKDVFEQENIPFPILLLRNSALIVEDNPSKKIEKLGFDINDIFKSEAELHSIYIARNSSDLDNVSEIESLNQLFEGIQSRFSTQALRPSIDAELQKQKNSLNKLFHKIQKQEKVKHEVALSQISKLKEDLFPCQSLQERHLSFIPFYLKHGDNFIKNLKNHLNPLDVNFVILQP